MLPQEIIRRKRDGAVLSSDDIATFVTGLTQGAVTESQAAAFAMAVLLRGMDMDERVALTRAMLASGETLDWKKLDLGGPTLDKHSTGGVGDNVSLMLAPMVAACGGFVPMISGRGLGHTGGTLDKLDSIPGYTSQPDLALLRKALKEAGCAIIGQTADLAPADKRLYAIRDVTATVESIPLITASILSKKLAAGLDGLAMDVKSGNGAFMPTLEGARELASSIAEVARGAGLPTTVLITDMNEPLASAAGNAVEVLNAIRFLKGEDRDLRLLEVTMALGGEMLLTGKLASNAADAHAKLMHALDGGAACEHFAKMVSALGGPADLVERADHHLPTAPVTRDVCAREGGFVTAIDTRAIGLAVVTLGGGRRASGDSIDHGVGITRLARLGASLTPDAPFAYIHARSEEEAAEAEAAIAAAYTIGPKAPHIGPAVLERFA